MKTAVISGGNGGLGRALAKILNEKGWHTVLMDVNTEGLQANDQQTPVQVDLTNPTALEAETAHILARFPTIDLVIYNAGVTQISSFADSDDAGHRRVFDINYFAAVKMARGFLKAVRASRGTHLAISSVAGFAPLHNRTSYAASKHAMEGFFNSLRSEELPHGVSTLIAAPSFVATNIGRDKMEKDGVMRPGASADGLDYMTPESAAAIIIKGVEKRKEFIPVGRIATLSSLVIRLSPKLFQWIMRRSIKGRR